MQFLKRYQIDDWYQQSLQAQDFTEEKEKGWDRLAEGHKTREHVPTAAEREQW